MLQCNGSVLPKSKCALTKDTPYRTLRAELWVVQIWQGQTKDVPEIIQRTQISRNQLARFHDEVIKWKHFPRYWPFVHGIHRSPVNSLHKGQWCRAFMFSFICAWIYGWINNCEAGDLRCHRTHSDVIVMFAKIWKLWIFFVESWEAPGSPSRLERFWMSNLWAFWRKLTVL